DEPALRVLHRRARRVGQPIGVEHVLRRRLRVAAGALAAEPLEARLRLMAAGGGPEVRRRAGELAVVALLGIARAEVRRVVDEAERVREERGIEDVRARRSAVALELEVPLRV